MKKTSCNDPGINPLILELSKCSKSLEAAQMNFNNSTDPELIDYYIYKIKSEQHRYAFLLNQAKALNI